MKKLLVGLFMMFVGVASATTINLSWMVDNNTYAQTTCESGGNLNIPTTTPTKRGYHFIGWDFYTRLEYIESTGTQYIDTGIVLKGTDVVEVKYSNVNRTNTSCLLFGYYKSSADNRFAYNFWQSAIRGGYFYYGAEQEQISTPPTDDGLAHIIKLGNGSLYHDSTLIKSGMSSNFTASENMFLFASSGPNLFQTKARVHYAKITDNNNTLIFDGVPARRNSDNVLGMYDTVSGQFFTNQGTGDFIAGPVSANQTLE